MASPSEPPRVLLTGASGFTGAYVGAALTSAGMVPVDAAEHGLDLLDSASIERVVREVQFDDVIHLAAISFVGSADEAAFYAVNTVGTGRLLEALARRARQPRKVIVASSANVYGNSNADPISEDVPPAPVNHYACSKYAMECIARTFSDRLPLLVTRPFNYTGVGQPDHFLVPKLVQHFAAKAPAIKLGNLDVVRDFSDVRAVAEAYSRLLRSGAGGTLNVCSGTGRSLRWIMDTLAELSGHRIAIEVDPALVRASEIRRLVGDRSRLAAAVGDTPFGDFRETLAWMLRDKQRSER